MLAAASLEAEAASSTKVSVSSSNHSCRSLIFCFWFLWKSRHWSLSARRRLLLLRVLAGRGAESSRIESCGPDVEDVLVDELEDLVNEPGTTIGHEILRVAWYFPAVFDEMWFLTTGPLHRKTRGLRRVFQATELLELKSLTCTVASSFVCTSPLAVMTVVRFLKIRRVSSSAKFRSFLLSMCMLAPESTTTYLSSGFVHVDAGRHQTSESEKKVALSFSLSMRTPTAIFHASLRAHRSCFKVSSSDLSSKLGEHRDYAHENQCAEPHLAMDPFFPEFSCGAMHNFENCTLRFRILVPFRKIELDFGGSTSENTPPNFLEFFDMATEP